MQRRVYGLAFASVIALGAGLIGSGCGCKTPTCPTGTVVQALHATGQTTSVPPTFIDLTLQPGTAASGQQPITGTYTATPLGGASFTGQVNGSITGTFANNGNGGNFVGTVQATLPGCTASRQYEGPLTRTTLAWVGQAATETCGGSSPLTFDVNLPATVDTSVPPAAPSVSLAVTQAQIPAAGQNGTVQVTANVSWSAASNQTWLTTGSAGSGNGTLSYAVPVNPGAARIGVITVAHGSATATLTVNQAAATAPTLPPTIATQPQSQTIVSGQTGALSVTAAGTAPFSYQWYVGASGTTTNPVAGATASTFTTPALTSTTSYWVRVTNAAGSVDSATATVTVAISNTAPSIATQPQSQSILSGQTGTLSVTAAGTAPFSYQWYAGASGTTTNPVAGATASSFTTPALTTTTSYWVRVTNAAGSVDSATATITITVSVTPPTITTQPQSQTIASGQTATLSVSASGTAPFTYQWFVGTSPTTTNPVAGATASSFTTPALTTTTSYWVKLTNAAGSANSSTATITVSVTPPTIATQPQSQTIASGQTAPLSVTAAGTAPFTYQWFVGASPTTTSPVAGATASSFTTPALTSTTSYWVRVTNAGGNADSSTATITVAPPVPCTSFTVNQSATTVADGGLITFDVKPLPTGCLWVAKEGDSIGFDNAVVPQTPWTFSPVKVFAGDQTLTARAFNHPGTNNPSHSTLTAGIDFRGSDATGTVLSGVLKHVTFTITP